MTDTELNKKVHRLIGRCWHEFVPSDDNLEWSCEHCSKLDTEILNSSINLLTWEGLGIVLNWLRQNHSQATVQHVLNGLDLSTINPRTFADAIWEMFGEKEAK